MRNNYAIFCEYFKTIFTFLMIKFAFGKSGERDLLEFEAPFVIYPYLLSGLSLSGFWRRCFVYKLNGRLQCLCFLKYKIEILWSSRYENWSSRESVWDLGSIAERVPSIARRCAENDEVIHVLATHVCFPLWHASPAWLCTWTFIWTQQQQQQRRY